ncbi:MAG: TonB family protein [Xenococcaceae cyanobacterium]
MMTVERKGKLKIQISLDPFLLFVLTSVLIHGLGVLILVLSNRSLPTARQETESTPIDFIVVPPEESPEEPPPDTERRATNNSVAKGPVKPELPSATNKIGNEEAITTSQPSQGVQPKRQATPLVPKLPQTPPAPRVEPKPVTPPSSPTKVPKQAIAPSNPTPPVASKPKPRENAPPPPVASKPKPRENTPLLSESNPTSIPLPKTAPLQEEKPSREIETASPKPDLPPVATKLPTKPAPTEPPSQSAETAAPPPASEQQTPVGSGSAGLLGGTYRKTLADNSGSSFFNPQANASQQALNSGGLDARQDLNMGPYFAEIRRRVRRHWKPSSPGNDRHTVLAFSIQRNGQVTGLRIVQSSGSEKVDRDSVAAVQKSAPFAALPANFPEEKLDVQFSFNIYVNHGVFTPQLENWQRF